MQGDVQHRALHDPLPSVTDCRRELAHLHEEHSPACPSQGELQSQQQQPRRSQRLRTLQTMTMHALSLSLPSSGPQIALSARTSIHLASMASRDTAVTVAATSAGANQASVTRV